MLRGRPESTSRPGLSWTRTSRRRSRLTAMRRLLLSLALLKKTKWALSIRSQESRSRGRAKDGRGRRTRRRVARVRWKSRGFIVGFYHSGKAEPARGRGDRFPFDDVLPVMTPCPGHPWRIGPWQLAAEQNPVRSRHGGGLRARP